MNPLTKKTQQLILEFLRAAPDSDQEGRADRALGDILGTVKWRQFWERLRRIGAEDGEYHVWEDEPEAPAWVGQLAEIIKSWPTVDE